METRQRICEYIAKSALCYGKAKKYYDCLCSFDIETSPIKHRKQSFIYSWQFAAEDKLLIGRTVKELRSFFIALSELKQKIVIYVHNLTYEFSFIKTLLKFDKILAVRSRKILCAYWRNLEFRCSYLLSNMSLRKYLEKWQVICQKTELDYSLMRYPWSPLNNSEIEYISNDVLGLNQAIRKEMEFEGLNLATIPLTSTGYVRREMKSALVADKELVNSLHLPPFLLNLAQECYRGGDTHANRFKAGKIIEGVKTKDINSSYPYELQHNMFPCEPFRKAETLEECERQWDKFHPYNPFMARFAFTKIRLKNILNPAPYISLSKTRRPENYCLDNGRVLGADYLEISLTDIDWRIIKEDYIWEDMRVWDIYQSRYSLLPDSLVALVERMYEQKTSLKGVDEYMYAKYKNLINSVYGACVQNPMRGHLELRYSSDKSLCEIVEQVSTEDDLEDFYKSTPTPYVWGVWVTAHARAHLREGIRFVGDDFVYCDTDSVKYTGEHDFSQLNNPSNFSAKDRKGREYYLGWWDDDPKYKRFITWGAKKYAYEYEDGHLGITISGVEKVKGAEYLAENGGLEALKPGFVFKGCGGKAVAYNDKRPDDIELCSGHKIEMLSSAYLYDVDYELTLAGDYERELKKANELSNYSILFKGIR